jgi:hypothetical protein
LPEGGVQTRGLDGDYIRRLFLRNDPDGRYDQAIPIDSDPPQMRMRIRKANGYDSFHCQKS